MIKIRRVRRLVVAGAAAEAAFDAPPAVPDRPDPPVDELVARVVDVIEVPYLKPIARRRRHDRIGCRFVWPAKLDATLGDMAGNPRDAVDPAAPPSPVAPASAPIPTGMECRGDVAPPAKPLLPTIVGGMAAACGYVLANVATGGLAVFAASLAVAVAMLVSFVAASNVVRPGRASGSTARVVAAAAALALTAIVTAGAGVLRPA